MPHSTIGGDDPDHSLSPEAKRKRERELRDQARKLIAAGDTKDGHRLQNRAQNISRAKSKRAQHH